MSDQLRGEAGQALWARFVPVFDLDEREREVLLLACSTADDVHDLETLVANGAPVSARAELRMTRAALARLLGQLRLPIDDGTPRTEKQLRAQRAAETRWARSATVREERKHGST